MIPKTLSQLVSAGILALILVSGCRTADRYRASSRTVSFVQLTDPHLFLDTSKDADPVKKATRLVQEKLDQSALTDAWKSIPTLTGGDQPISFVVVTGDFGVEPCSIADLPAKPTPKDCVDKANTDKRNAEISLIADELGASPIRDIYLIPGNNDIAYETATDDGLAYFNHLIDDVQKKIDDAKKSVRLHNLNRCYEAAAASSTRYFDVPGTAYRMVGFPSYSFKNREPGSDANPPLQEKQLDVFLSVLDEARQSGKKVLILSHIPLIDDPFTMGQDRYAGINPPPAINGADASRSPWSTWNVSKKVADEWKQAIGDDSVVAILAGHFHDSHKEIYQRPFAWSSVNDPKNGFEKLYLAPPLSVKNQDASPVQARGLAVVNLDPQGIRYQIFWYKAKDGSFAPADGSGLESQEHGGRIRHCWWATRQAILWLWRLDAPQSSLESMVILLIALLAAFLTVVQISNIPAPEYPLRSKNPPADAQTDSRGATQAGATQPDATKPAFDPSPFASNFGKTVITGLGGLAAAAVVKSFDGNSNPADNQFYIVWFILFFISILITIAALRAIGEALRERLILVHPKPEPPHIQRDQDSKRLRAISWAGSWAAYLWSRFWNWLWSLRFSALTFFDTFINLIQGKNQTLTRVFSDTIIKQQRNVVCVAQVLRQQLNDLILHHINRVLLEKGTADKQGKEIDLRDSHDVRVNISVLSEDGSSVFYIARSPGSSQKVFPKHSLAWVSVFTGNIRWYKHDYYDDKKLFKDIVLFDNSSGLIPGGEVQLMLNSYYQQRQDDYEAFVIFPVPWPQRAFGSAFVRGAIHISFRKKADFEEIWEKYPKPDPLSGGEKEAKESEEAGAEKLITYPSPEEMLGAWCKYPEIKTCLRQSVAILSQLLHGFNDDIYRSSKHSDGCS
jgi:hypothetical protein